MANIISGSNSDLINMNEYPFNKGDRVRIKNYVDPAIYDGMITIGNEAWVRGMKEDRWGLPMVLIEWDKNHWTYNGAPDGWTFAEHFEKVESSETMPEKSDKPVDFGRLLSGAIRGIRKEEPEAQTDENLSEPHRIEVGPGPVPASPIDIPVKTVLDRSARDKLAAPVPTPSHDPEPIIEDRIGAIREVEDAMNNDALNKVEAQRDEALDQAFEKLCDADAFIIIGVERFEDAQAKHGGLSPYVFRFAINKDSEMVADAFLSSVSSDIYQELVIKTLVDYYKSLENNESSK